VLLLTTACAAAPVPDPADDDDATEPPDEGWSAGEPDDVVDGSRLYGTLACAIFAEPAEKAWQKQDDRWIEIPGFEGEIQPGLGPCITASDRHLFWEADGTITFLAGGWEHRLGPTETEDLWFGETEPIEPPSDGCTEALGESALELPVALTFERTAFVVP